MNIRTFVEFKKFFHNLYFKHFGCCSSSFQKTNFQLEVIQPSLSNPTSGNLDISVDISPSTSITMDGRTLDSAGAKIAADLQSILLDSDALDLETLSIIAGKFSWCLHVDLLVRFVLKSRCCDEILSPFLSFF